MAISKEQKAAMAVGRVQSRAVDRYLTVLRDSRPKRGRKRTVESINKQLAEIEEQLADASPLKALAMTQQQADLRDELVDLESTEDTGEAEVEFIKVAKEYSDRKGIRYPTWRAQGVPADVLKKAGVTRGS